MKIGIDLGTANVLVYVKGKGIVIQEPSVVAVSDDNRIVAVGEEAREMIGRTPGNIQAIRPMKDGVIADYVITEAMLRFFIAKATKGRIGFTRPDVMISVPAGVTSVEKRAVRDAALKAGAKEAYLIEEPLAAAIGANVPISGPSGNMIIDIGGGTSEIAVIALGGIVVSHSLRVGGNRFDESIATYIRKKYNLMVGERTAEEVKIQIGTALPLERELQMEVRGRDLIAGLPRTIPITSSEVMEAIEAPLQQLVAAVRSVLEQTPPELSTDIIDKGMVMSGGGALLRNIDKLLTQVTGVPVPRRREPAQLRRPRDRPRAGALRLLQEVPRPAGLSGPTRRSAAQRREARPPDARRVGERTAQASVPSSTCTATRAAASTRCRKPADVVRAAAERGLTHLAITDHDRIDGALAARDAAPGRPDGHRRRGDQDRRRRSHRRSSSSAPIPPGLSAVETIAAVREQGGLVGIPHPFDRFRGSLLQDARDWRRCAELVDWIETHNARLVGGGNEHAPPSSPRSTACPASPSSDAHTRPRGRRRVHRARRRPDDRRTGSSRRSPTASSCDRPGVLPRRASGRPSPSSSSGSAATAGSSRTPRCRRDEAGRTRASDGQDHRPMADGPSDRR